MEEGSGFLIWDELLADALGLIFKKLTLVELLTVIPRVCKSWRKVVMGPYCWQEIDIQNWSYKNSRDFRQVDKMLQLLLPRSGGSLRELSVTLKSNDSLLFVANHAQCLQTLKLADSSIEDVAIEKAAPMLSAITSLDLSYCFSLGPQAFEAIGKHCKSLTSFKRSMRLGDITDDISQAIAASMPHLKNLEIRNLQIDTSGVVMIVENCKHLELLDIRGCFYVDLADEFFKRFPKLKVLGPGREAVRIVPWDDDYNIDNDLESQYSGTMVFGSMGNFRAYVHSGYDVVEGGIVFNDDFYPYSDSDDGYDYSSFQGYEDLCDYV